LVEKNNFFFEKKKKTWKLRTHKQSFKVYANLDMKKYTKKPTTRAITLL